MPVDQVPSQSFGEYLEVMKRELGCTFTGGLGNKLGDSGNGRKDERRGKLPVTVFQIICLK